MTRSTGAPKELRTLVEVGCTGDLTDGQLLERFQRRSASSETAFEALVDRHAAMVWGVCRRSLDRADAEDAFQATFLVLVRRAGAIRTDDRDSAGRWLYGVARRVASRLRQEAARRPPAAVDSAPAEDPASLAERRDARETVIAELDRLPTKYRRPIELCDFEGLTYEQAGVFLGWPTATLKNRLAQGRSRLRDRLIRRGLAPAALIALARESQAAVPKALVHSTCRAGAITSGTIPVAVARLTEGAIRTMFLDRMKTLALIASMGFGAAAVAGMAVPGGEETGPPPAASDAGKTSQTPDPRFSKRMPSGALIEIVAVSSAPLTRVWWKPDGTPLAEPPCDLMDPVSNPGYDDEDGRYRILFRVTDVHEYDDNLPAMGLCGLGYTREVRRDGEIVPGLRIFILGQTERRDPAYVGFQGAFGPWKTVQHWSPASSGRSSNDHRGERRISTTMRGDQGRAIATMVHEIDPRDSTFRIIAVDEQDREIERTDLKSIDNETFSMVQATFNQPPEKIHEFRFQSRRLGSTVIDGISLHPNKPVPPR
ncbi:RNA polymerase sigma factor [Paludisphaera rhizosphaerae]|uniref:RNA polymerase sigma factor n=1 Tax=Paludisphaera rhizosphaerae TaxID=2711216 RepID=UPI0013EDCEE1|nr:RNA polymerase sigma factor [Paludisphaera rhizosphaerae]